MGVVATVYRGDCADFDGVFSADKTRQGVFFFTCNPAHAAIYAGARGAVRRFELKAERVLDLRDCTSRTAAAFLKGFEAEFDEWIDRYSGEPTSAADLLEAGMLYDYEGTGSGTRWTRLFRYAQEQFDMVVVHDATDGSPADVVVVFEPQQITLLHQIDPALRVERLASGVIESEAPPSREIPHDLAVFQDAMDELEGIVAGNAAEFLQLVMRSNARLAASDFHGPDHWSRVRANGVRLAQTEQADARLITLFALAHDCQRRDEGEDSGHGPRAAEWLRVNAHHLKLSSDEIDAVALACEHHSTGIQDPAEVARFPRTLLKTMACCWDADRLDLPRVGITPDPDRMCTPTGVELADAYGSRRRVSMG